MSLFKFTSKQIIIQYKLWISFQNKLIYLKLKNDAKELKFLEDY